jgi:prepilin-type N-terminal cleavage/methylation domain-containing protein
MTGTLRTRTAFLRMRPGFTLIEMLVVMWALGVILLLSSVTLLGALRVGESASKAHNRLMNRIALADQFRDDVSQAVEAPDALNERRAGPSCLILRRADNRYVVYRWQDERLERGEGRAEANLAWQSVQTGSDRVIGNFARSGPGQRLVILRLSEYLSPAGVTREAFFSAALGGDLR